MFEFIVNKYTLNYTKKSSKYLDIDTSIIKLKMLLKTLSLAIFVFTLIGIF